MTPQEEQEMRRLSSAALQNAHAINRVRQRAELELFRERERLRITLASIGDAVISTDADGRVTFLNSVAERLTGWKQADALDQPLSDVFHIIDEFARTVIDNPALRALREGTVVGVQNHTMLVARDGSARPIDDSAAPMRDEAGNPLGAVLVFRDVSERRKVEEMRARLAAIVESSDDAIVSKTLDGIIRTWNAGAERLFGYTAAEAVGQPITLIIPPERHEEERGIIARLVRGERIEHFETVRVSKDGRRLDISLTVSPMRDSEGRIIGASKIARDITAQKRTADAVSFLADASASLAELVDYESTLHRIANLAVGRFADWCVVDILDERGKPRRLSVSRPESHEIAGVRAADAAFSSDESDPTGIPHVLRTGEPEIVPDVSAADPAVPAPVAERLARLRDWGVRSYLSVPLLSRGQAIGGMTFMISTSEKRFGPDDLRVARDLAERVTSAIENAQLYRQLQDQDRRKDEFLATLAHELRNPLAPLRNGMQILRAVLQDDDRVIRTLGMMERQLGHMVHLVDDLMDVARVSSGKVVLRRERVNLRAVVDSAVEATRQAVDAGGHSLSIDLPAEPLVFDADRTRLAQVIANLLHNSAKYTPQGGRISLSAERDGTRALIRVADNGIGIPTEMLPRIFDMFAQVGTSLERSQGGLGIGLTLVKRLVEMHGGSIVAESPGPGEGSTFTLRLPLAADKSSDGNPTAEPSDLDIPALRVLVVDDNRDAAESMALLLELKGHEIRTAHDGPEALRILGSYRPHLILLDIGLPGMNGYEVARRIRDSSEFRNITLTALTGWGQEEDRTRSRLAGFDFHLTKPAAPDDVEKILNNVHRRIATTEPRPSSEVQARP